MTCDLASVADDPLSVPLCHGALSLVQNPFPVDLEPRGLVLPPSSGTDRVSLKVESQELAEELQRDETKLLGGSTPLVADACVLRYYRRRPRSGAFRKNMRRSMASTTRRGDPLFSTWLRMAFCRRLPV
jgi:hypothetical protein